MPDRTQVNYPFSNREIAEIFQTISDMMKIQGENRFKILAYQDAARTFTELGRSLADIYAAGELQSIPGVGMAIADKVGQLLRSGQMDLYEELRAAVPQGVVEMMRVPDVGPKTAKRMWEELGVTSVDELAEAAQAQRIRDLKGFSAKSEANILRGIASLRARGEARMPLGEARPMALALSADLQAALPAALLPQIEAAGSVRRWQETIGDMDLLAVSPAPQRVMECFRGLDQVETVLAAGDTKSRVRLHSGLEVDLRVVEERHWGAALQYFTGSKEHNVAVREIALKQGWSLNEYGLTATERNPTAAAGTEQTFATEEALYNFLGLAWVPPELRENRGEVDAARSRRLPALITLPDLQGEVHGHTRWSDGTASVAQMAEAARGRGYRYWSVSDHSVGLGVVQGVDGAALARQAAEIEAVNRRCRDEGHDFRLLRGVEVEILADGSLALPDAVLAELDVVVASIHSAQRQEQKVITARCLRAVQNPHVDILGHPTGRLLGKRPPTELDMEAVLQACAATGTVVEINAHPSRLDLNDLHARRAVELGCRMVINSDAHSTDGMEIMEYGIATARRAWLTAAHVINTRPLDEMLALLKPKE